MTAALNLFDEEPPTEPRAPEPSQSPEATSEPGLTFDLGRPWPLGLPSIDDAMLAVLGRKEVSSALESAHLHVLTLFPEWLFDEARSALGGTPNEIALAAASAWRASVAAAHIEAALAVDVPAVLTLVDETVHARETLVGAASFSLDGGESCEELISAVDESIGRFVVLSRHHQRQRPVMALSDGTRILSIATVEPKPPSKQRLPLVFGLCLAVSLAFHLANWLGGAPPSEWVVIGNVESGHAVLVPGGPGATDAARDAKLAELRAAGVTARDTGDGAWVLQGTRK